MNSLTRIRHVLGTFTRQYARVFSVDEIREQPILQWYFGASMVFFLLAFDEWINASSTTVEAVQRGSVVCWSYFQTCHKLLFLHDLTVDYSRSIFYMGLYAILVLIAWCMWRKRWEIAHALLFLLLLWESFFIFVLAYHIAAPYYYYHIFLTTVLLLVPHKEFFLKITFVFLYFMSATIKFDSTWILGTYFTSLKNGLPILPDALTTLFTNAVIAMQIVGCWFLLSRRWVLQRLALTFFVLFHLYSGTLVYYYYVTTALPPLLILFGPLYRYTPIPFVRSAVFGWVIIALIGAFQILGFIIPGDRRLTLEGNRYGMYMFEANHQCVITVKSTYAPEMSKALAANWESAPGTRCTDMYCLVKVTSTSSKKEFVREERYESGTSRYRCDIYEWWTRYQRRCESAPGLRTVALTYDHSIDGGPFYRMVESSDFCSLEYKPFVHNDWIRLPPEAPIIGYPVQNAYRD